MRRDVPYALAAGVALALMTDRNAALARASSAVFASWVAHGVGTFGSLLLVASSTRRTHPAPIWAYLGGIPGAATVIVVSVTVNGSLGLARSFALSLLAQVVFGVVSDIFGLFALPKRRPAFLGVVLVGLGTAFLLGRQHR